jgi:hypothetical protein
MLDEQRPDFVLEKVVPGVGSGGKRRQGEEEGEEAGRFQ